MRGFWWGGVSYYNMDDQRLSAAIHLALCKNLLGSKTGYLYESEPDECKRRHVSVLGLEIENRYRTANETLWHLGDNSLMRELLDLAPEQIREKHPCLYNSMIYHFGSVKEAFKQRNWDKEINALIRQYSHHEDLSPYWAREVVPFLTEMTDREIADVCKCSPRRIADIRLIVQLQSSKGLQQFEKADQTEEKIDQEIKTENTFTRIKRMVMEIFG